MAYGQIAPSCDPLMYVQYYNVSGSESIAVMFWFHHDDKGNNCQLLPSVVFHTGIANCFSCNQHMILKFILWS